MYFLGFMIYIKTFFKNYIDYIENIENDLIETQIKRIGITKELFLSGNKERIVADFIAGMTDRYAVSEHQQLFDHTPELR